MPIKPITSAESGVNIDANTRFVAALQAALKSTYGPRVCSRDGSFAGMFRMDYDEQLFRRNFKKPVLVGCTDGVGSKVLLAAQLKRYEGIGLDLVAMNVNDLITCGAEPLFFLDYLAVHRLDPEALLPIVESIAKGCRESGCALLGGETSEMPDVYREGDFDLAGFCVGVVELRKAIDGTAIEPGDIAIGLPSNGIHSNGYSLVRRLIRDHGLRLDKTLTELGEPLAEAVIRPTRIYVEPVLSLLRRYRVKRVITGMAHITGGGLPENVGRALPAACDVVLEKKRWPLPPIFPFIQNLGVDENEMYRVFNMGIGFVIFVRPAFAAAALRHLQGRGEKAVIIGKVRKGRGQVILR